MAESFTQVAPNSTGNKMRVRRRTVGGNVVDEQYVAQAADPTYYIWVPEQALAANKYHIAVLNTSATQVIKLRKLFLINAALAAVTGVGVKFDIRRISTITAGTAVTANPADTGDGALSGATVVSAPTSVTEGVLLYSWFTNNDEIGLTNAFPTAMLQQIISNVPEGPELKEINLRQNEGFAVKQITSSVIGSYAVLAVVTVEAI